MEASAHIVLRVVRAPEGSSLSVGATFPVPAPQAVVGRSPEADVVLADGTVSRQHLRIHAGPPVLVEALTSSNGTFLDREPLGIGVAVPLPTPTSRLQLGGVVLAVIPLAETTPVVDPLPSLAREARSEPVLQVRWDAGQCSIRCRGRDLGLSGAPARLLGLLAEHAGEVVHHWDLQQELDTPHLAPLASAVRAALARTVHEGVVPRSLFQARLISAQIAPEAVPTDPTELMRRVVQARRGHGYVLHLDRSDVEVERI